MHHAFHVDAMPGIVQRFTKMESVLLDQPFLGVSRRPLQHIDARSVMWKVAVQVSRKGFSTLTRPLYFPNRLLSPQTTPMNSPKQATAKIDKAPLPSR